MKITLPVKVLGYSNKKSSKDNTTWCTVYCTTEEIEENGEGFKTETYCIHSEKSYIVGCEYTAEYTMNTYEGKTTLRCEDIK